MGSRSSSEGDWQTRLLRILVCVQIHDIYRAVQCGSIVDMYGVPPNGS